MHDGEGAWLHVCQRGCLRALHVAHLPAYTIAVLGATSFYIPTAGHQSRHAAAAAAFIHKQRLYCASTLPTSDNTTQHAQAAALGKHTYAVCSFPPAPRSAAPLPVRNKRPEHFQRHSLHCSSVAHDRVATNCQGI